MLQFGYKKSPCRRMCLNACFLVGGTVLKDCGAFRVWGLVGELKVTGSGVIIYRLTLVLVWGSSASSLLELTNHSYSHLHSCEKQPLPCFLCHDGLYHLKLWAQIPPSSLKFFPSHILTAARKEVIDKDFLDHVVGIPDLVLGRTQSSISLNQKLKQCNIHESTLPAVYSVFYVY